MIKLRLLAKLKIKNCGIKNITWMNISMYTRYVSLIDNYLEDEQRTTASTEIYCCWIILMFSESFTLHHRIVIISYYQKCNGFLVQCICMACVVKNDNLRMHVSTNWYNQCCCCSFILGFCLWLPDFVMKDLKTILSLHHLKFIWRVVND